MTSLFVFGTLFRYFALRYLAWVALCVLGLAGIVSIIQTVELIRRVSVLARDNVEMNFIAMAFLNMPSVIELILPFGLLAGSMLCFNAWNKSNEFTVTRGLGHSIWTSLSPVVISALAVGIGFIAIINPIGSVTSQRYENQMDAVFGGNQQNLTVNADGVWLKDIQQDRRFIIHGDQLNVETSSIMAPIIYSFSNDEGLEWRMRGISMRLTQSGWIVEDAVQWSNDGLRKERGDIMLATQMTSLNLMRSSAPPHTIPVFSLPQFIGVLEQAGLPSVEHRIYLHQLLALPLLMIGISMLGARFTLRNVMRGRPMQLFTRGVVIAVTIFFFSYFMKIMGTSLRVPPTVAGWAPAVIVFLAGAAFIARLDES